MRERSLTLLCCCESLGILLSSGGLTRHPLQAGCLLSTSTFGRGCETSLIPPLNFLWDFFLPRLFPLMGDGASVRLIVLVRWTRRFAWFTLSFPVSLSVDLEIFL